MRAAGHTVHQYVVPNPTKFLPTLASLANSPYNIGAARQAVRRAREVGADVAHIHNTWFALSPSVPSALSRAGLPVVTTMHNYRAICISGTLFRDGVQCTSCLGGHAGAGIVHRCYENRGLSTVASATVELHRLLGTWTKHTDLVLVPSETARDVFIRDGYDPAKLWVKENFTVDPGPRLAPPSASRTVLFVGRLRREKGTQALVEAWRRSRHDGLRLVVVGDGTGRPLMERTAPDDVTFTGTVPQHQVAELMLSARALIFPSLWLEPFGLTLIEAMAARLPVVGYDVSDSKRITGDGGLLVPPGDVDELARAIERLCDDALVDAIGNSGRTQYEQRFSPKVHTPALVEAYRGAAPAPQGLKRGPRPTAQPAMALVVSDPTGGVMPAVTPSAEATDVGSDVPRTPAAALPERRPKSPLAGSLKNGSEADDEDTPALLLSIPVADLYASSER